MKLERIRLLKAQIEAIVSQKAVGFMADVSLKTLAKLADERIEYQEGITSLQAEKAKIEKSTMEAMPEGEKSLSDLVRRCLENEKYKKLLKKEDEIYQQEATDFHFEPVEILPSSVIYERFKDGAIPVNYRGKKHQIEPYQALHELIEEGFIKVKE